MSNNNEVNRHTMASMDPAAWLVEFSDNAYVTLDPNSASAHLNAKPDWNESGLKLDVTPLYRHPQSAPASPHYEDFRATALELCDVIENKNDLQLHRWAIKSAYLVSKLRKLLDDAP